MAITITIDNEAVDDGGTYIMPDAVVESGITSSTIRIFVTSGTTLQSVSTPSWGRGVSVDSSSLPISFGGPDVHELPITPASRRGVIDPNPYIGAYWKQFTITYDEGGPDLTFTFRVVGRIGTTAGTPLSVTFEEFQRTWVANVWNIGANSDTEANPFGLGWSVNNGHMAFATTHAGPSIQEGCLQQFLWIPFGRTQELTGDTDLQFDQFVESAELRPDDNIWRDEWDDAMEYLFGLDPNVRIFVYLGSLRNDSQFLEFFANNDAAGFVDRFFRSLEPILKYPRLELCLDVPYRASDTAENPRIIQGEARYEANDMIRKLLALQSRRVYCEPRPPVTEPHWGIAGGWDHVMVDRSWWRANPAWYADASGASPDSVLGKLLNWLLDGDDDINPSYKIADTLHNDNVSVLQLRQWFSGGRTMENLYDETMEHLQFIRTGVSP